METSQDGGQDSGGFRWVDDGLCERVTCTPHGILDTLVHVNSSLIRFPEACGAGFRLGHVVLEEPPGTSGGGGIWQVVGRQDLELARQSCRLWGLWRLPPGLPPRS